MSRPLQYAEKCIECGRVMKPGTEASWVKDGKGYSWFHSPECPKKPTGEPPVQPVAKGFEYRYCSRLECSNSHGVAFSHRLLEQPGAAIPSRCSCGSDFLLEPVWMAA